VLIEASRRYGIPEAKLNDILEKGPNWWERLLQDVRPYRIALQAALCELAQDGNLVYHGHLGHELLPGISHVLKVFLTAPMEFRIEQIRARQNLSESAARRYMEDLDDARSRRLIAMFGTDWRDPNRYDLTVNVGKLSREGATRVIIETAKLEEYQPTAASTRAFKDIALASRVQATLFGSPGISGSALEVSADGGHVHIKGRADQGAEDEIVNCIRKVAGVREVTTDLFYIPPQAFFGP
jgi:hypothetical protein